MQYTLDGLIVVLRVGSSVLDGLMRRLGAGADKSLGFVKKQWMGRGVGGYRYNYSIEVENGESYYFGVEPILDAPNEYWTYCKVDFNPAKVGNTVQFESLYNILLLSAKHVDFKRFDVAIDIPIAREKARLYKDGRRYLDYYYSVQNRTEYLGQRSQHGQVKLYNKALEQGSLRDLTRLEITMDYENSSFAEFRRIFPKVLLLGNDEDIQGVDGTELVLLMACREHADYVKMLGRKMRKKIEQLLETTAQRLEPDEVLYKCILTEILQYGNRIQPETWIEIEQKDDVFLLPVEFTGEQEEMK